ncbi:MAG TPA: sigma 54-interacting transcriptional regulator [Desulfohalobiaceae bacterium]|nr:sigma 54-interacting transcriptional regulator [Desulfohalobiaceae bacterium]
MVDSNDFFKEATLRICGSLDVEVSLWESFQFLRNYLPADEMMLNIYSPDEGNLRVLAQATPEGGKWINRIIPLPNEVRKLVDLNCSKKKLPHDKVLVINQPHKHTVASFLYSSLKLVDGSLLTMPLFIEGNRLGVVDIIAKGFEKYNSEHARIFGLLQEPFAIAVANALRHQDLIEMKDRLADENSFLQKQLEIAAKNEKVIGADSGLKGVMQACQQVAPMDNTVLILGETGVGKEIVARTIHRISPRAEKPFIKVNCGAIPSELVDSELFGHEKGAFTGAVARKLGRFERAHTGTILLDEIGELSAQAQIRLLHVLQSREIERVGGTKSIYVDVRVIAATHRHLESMVNNGEFREDLWFRLNVFPIIIPPLRERKEDIPDFVRYIVKEKSKELGIEPPMVSDEWINSYVLYDWPGNVRELENTIERELIKNKGQMNPLSCFSSQAINDSDQSEPEKKRKLLSLDEVVKNHIQTALQRSQGKIHGPHGAAQILDVHPNTLRHRMKKLGISFKKNYYPRTNQE